MAANIDLINLWEWNSTTGDPFVSPEESWNSRYCPTLEEMDQLVTSRNLTGNYLRQRLYDFMYSNETRLVSYFDSHVMHSIMGYLRFVRALDIKKIHLEYGAGRLIMDKLPRSTPFLGVPDGVEHQIRNGNRQSIYVEDVNHNSLLGWLGPGTFPCNSSRCNFCIKVGRSPIVNLGPYGALHLTKRGSCVTRNAVYVGTCKQCEEEEMFTCYFGETTQTLVRRCVLHLSGCCNSRSILKDIANVDIKRAEIARVIAAGNDPDHVLQDWFAHITPSGVHPGQQRMSVVDVNPHLFLRKNKEKNLVGETMFRNGRIDYRGMGRGCLNTYSDA